MEIFNIKADINVLINWVLPHLKKFWVIWIQYIWKNDVFIIHIFFYCFSFFEWFNNVMVIVIAWVMILVSMHRLTRHPVIYLCTDRQIKSIEGCFAPKITYKHKISSFNILSYIKYLKYHCSGGAIVKILMSTNIKILDNIIVNSNIFFCQLLIELKSRVWEGWGG